MNKTKIKEKKYIYSQIVYQIQRLNYSCYSLFIKRKHGAVQFKFAYTKIKTQEYKRKFKSNTNLR